MDVSCSIAGSAGALRFDPAGSDGDEHSWRTVDLRDHYQFYHVLSAGGGVLRSEI